MLEKLIDGVIKRNGVCSSSDINSCSVRVNDNPLLSKLIVGDRLISDLEVGLQEKNSDILAILQNSQRKISYGNGGSRHVSASYLFNNLAEIDESLAIIKQNILQKNKSDDSNTSVNSEPVSTSE